MKISQMIKDIRQAKEDGKLVIFVGSGVSANSGIPTWGQLIKILAQELNYDKCNNCSCKSESCPKEDCELRYSFSQDEFLKIPEYYYNSYPDTYIDVIKKSLATNNPSNAIHNLIFKLLPHHIITTNLDPLLEETNEPYRYLYSVIREDRELLKQNKNQYLIKMHGDINNLEKAVLKEREYIEYEQTHPLISTYIKSLLIDHTFLFIGYSLNDYNLKIILGWVNHLARTNEISERPKNYIIQSLNHVTTPFETKYFEENNLYLIDPSELPKSLLNLSNAHALTENGKALHSCLEYIHNDSLDFQIEPLIDILFEKYESLAAYRRISVEDLLAVSQFKSVEVKGSTLVLWSDKVFQNLIEILRSKSMESNYIISILRKTGISSVYYMTRNVPVPVLDIPSFPFPEHAEFSLPKKRHTTIEDKLFSLYLNNRYKELLAQVGRMAADPEIKAFYYYLCKPKSTNFETELKKIEVELSLNDDQTSFNNRLISLLYFKLNQYLVQLYTLKYSDFIQTKKDIDSLLVTIPKNMREPTTFLRKLCQVDPSNVQKMFALLTDHENIYQDRDLTYFDGEYGKLLEIQAIAYDFYFYYKQNYLFYEHSEMPSKYFEPYLKAILCTYCPEKNFKRGFIRHPIPPMRDYALSAVDVDMFVKYTFPEHLTAWLNNYKVTRLSYEKGVNIVPKFKNFCESISMLTYDKYYFQLDSFAILLFKSSLSHKQKSVVIKAVVSLAESYHVNDNPHAFLTILPTIGKFFEGFPSRLWAPLLPILIDKTIIDLMIERGEESNYTRLLGCLVPYDNEDIHKRIDSFLKECDPKERIKYIYYLRKLIKNTLWMDELQKNADKIDNSKLFLLIIDKSIEYSDDMGKRYLNEVKSTVHARNNGSDKQIYPDLVEIALNNYIILHLIGIPVDISLLEPYREHSNVLDFLLHPNEFDYKKVDTDYFMWQNVLRSDQYLPFLKEHKSEILTDELEEMFSNNFLTKVQEKLIFEKLLGYDDAWGFRK